MSLKEKVDSMMLTIRKVKWSQHGYETNQVVSVLSAYIAELEAKLAAADKPAPAKKAPAKKAPTKKPAAKKAPAKKAPKKK